MGLSLVLFLLPTAIVVAWTVFVFSGNQECANYSPSSASLLWPESSGLSGVLPTVPFFSQNITLHLATPSYQSLHNELMIKVPAVDDDLNSTCLSSYPSPQPYFRDHKQPNSHLRSYGILILSLHPSVALLLFATLLPSDLPKRLPNTAVWGPPPCCPVIAY